MQPKGERLDPVGACDDANEESLAKSECNQCARLEDERDLLQSSFFALTTHFAQVQFRLRQIVNSPIEDQEELLNSLEEFAFADVNLEHCEGSSNIMDTVRDRRNQQKLLLGRLKSQLRELRDFDLRTSKTDIAWRQLLGHFRTKQDLEHQLKTQIADLERFVQHLTDSQTKSGCQQTKKSLKTYIVEIMERSFSFLQMFTLLQFNWGGRWCGSGATHWGDLRAELELAIIDLKKMLTSNEDQKKIAIAVRKYLAMSIRDLMQHGTKAKSQSLLPFMDCDCFSEGASTVHGWTIILYYYHFKKGDEFNSTAIQKLSRSFNLEIAGASPKNNKRNLLCAIESIRSTHSRYKRSDDSHFKAFVCAALNARRLVTWLNVIFHCGRILETFYYPWSYVASTRYHDGLRSLDMLTGYKFDLPVDLDVRKFQVEDNVFV